MITEADKSQLKALLQDRRWEVAERIAEMMIATVKDRSILSESEWDTVRAAVMQEGEIQGIRHFIQELYNQAGEAK